jgi:hypothetical protein
MARYSYDGAMKKLRSGQPEQLHGMAKDWSDFALAVGSVADRIDQAAATMTARPGQPYQLYQERAGQLATWLRTVRDSAKQVSTTLSHAGDVGHTSQAVMHQAEGMHQQFSMGSAAVGVFSPLPGAAMWGMGMVVDHENTAALNTAIDRWSGAFNKILPPPVPPVPNSTGAATGGPARIDVNGAEKSSGPGRSTSHGHATSDGAGTGGGPPTGAVLASAPVASTLLVVGPDGGDFAGWVRDPRTGFLINPATGQEFDPISRRWIDPVTGRPFGDAVRQSTHLEGLTHGVRPGAGDLGQLYGGVLPPSLRPGNPAVDLLRGQAMNTMAIRAYTAQQLAGGQAGRLPPPAATGGSSPWRSASVAGRGRSGGEAEETWTGRGAPRPRFTSEPEETWTGRGGAGRTGRAGYLPPGAGADVEPDRKRKRPEWLPGDDDVWRTGIAAGPSLLDEPRPVADDEERSGSRG